MANILTESFEGAASGDPITTTNSAVSATSGTPTFSNDTPFEGGLCAHLPSGAHSAVLPFTSGSDVWVAFALRFDAIPTSHTAFMTLRVGATQIADLQVASNAGNIRVRNGFVLAGTSTLTCTPGEWVQCALHLQPGTGMTLRIYDADGAHIEDVTATLDGTTIDTVALATVGTNTGVSYDWIRVDNATEPAPYTSGEPTPPTISTNVYIRVGGVWVPATGMP